MVGSRIDNPEPSIWLLRAIVAGTVLLSLLYAGLYLAWGAGPALAQAPWYNPMMFTFLALTCVCVAFLAFGRYGVLRDPVCFWIGMGFLGFTIGITFYVLTWPGLLPGGRSVLAHRTNTPAFLSTLAPSLLVLVLLVAALADGPGGAGKAASRWPWLAAAWLAFVTLLFALVVVFERRLPVLVTPEGAFTPMLLGWNTCLLVLFAAGAVLSIRRYRLLGNALLGYTAFFQIALFFSSLSVMIGGQRYDPWWYLNRVVLVGGALVVLFGHLLEYVHLFRRELEKTRRLQESEERFATAFRANPAALVLSRMEDGMILDVNDAFLDLFQWRRDEVLGKTSQALNMFADPAERDRAIALLRRQGRLRDYEVRIRRKSGQERLAHLSSEILHVPQGPSFLTIIEDITDRAHAQEALRVSEERFRGLVTASSQVLYQMSPDWSEMRQLQSRSFLANTDKSSPTWLQEYIPPDDQPRVLAAIEEAIRTKSVFELEHRVRRADGSLGWTFSRAVPLLNAKGAIVEWFGAASDVTERKRAEEALTALAEHNLANEVQVVKDGAEALDYLFRRGRYATRPAGDPVVVLLDIKMPRVDGVEVLRQIKNDPQLRLVPVVMLTSSREEKDLVESYRLGANAYVVKPLDFHAFIDAVKELSVFWAVINEPPPTAGVKQQGDVISSPQRLDTGR